MAVRGSVGLPRRLAVVPAPVEGEWLVSWVGRLRLSLELTWQDVWCLLGLARYMSTGPLPPVGWWLTLTAEKARNVAAASGLDERLVQRMLLSRYVGTALQTGTGLHDLQLDKPFRAGVGTGGLVRGRDAGCVLCLVEDGAWRASWCLPWTVACVRHEVYLTRSCVSCGRRLLHPAISLARTRRNFCTFPHEPVLAVPVRDPVILRVSQLIDRYAHVEGSAERAVASQWFIRLGEAMHAVPTATGLDAFESADELVRQRFAELSAHRLAARRKNSYLSHLPGFERWRTDVPLAAALMRRAVMTRGEGLGSPSSPSNGEDRIGS